MDTPKRIKNSTVKENTAVWLLIILGTLWFTLFSPQHPMKQWDPLARVLEKTRSWRTAKTKATNVVVLIGLACMLLLPDWAAMQQENYQTQSGNDPEETKQKVIQLIEENSTPEDTISVYGNWDIIYLRTGRRHATRFSYQLPIGKISPEIMQEYVEEIEEERPAVVVIAEDTESALLRETLLRCRYKLLWKQENDGVEVYKR